MLPLYYIPPDPTPTSLTRQRRRSGDPLEPAAVSGPIRDFLSVVKGYHFKRSGLLFVELACRSGASPITVGGAPTVVLLA